MGDSTMLARHAATRTSSLLRRSAQTESRRGLKVLLALYEDPQTGYPPKYARDSIPKVDRYPGIEHDYVQTAPTASAIDFTPGELLGCVSGELGLRKFLEDRGHTLVVTSDKDGDGCELEQHLPDTDIVMSQPFWPAYITRERMEMAPNLKMCVTCGIGSDHVDLQAAMERNITVTEVTYCNSISVSEHVCMMILGLVRNYIPSYQQVTRGGWTYRPGCAASHASIRLQTSLLRSPPPSKVSRGRTWPCVPRDCRGDGATVRCRHHQLPSPPRDRASL